MFLNTTLCLPGTEQHYTEKGKKTKAGLEGSRKQKPGNTALLWDSDYCSKSGRGVALIWLLIYVNHKIFLPFRNKYRDKMEVQRGLT